MRSPSGSKPRRSDLVLVVICLAYGVHALVAVAAIARVKTFGVPLLFLYGAAVAAVVVVAKDWKSAFKDAFLLSLTVPAVFLSWGVILIFRDLSGGKSFAQTLSFFGNRIVISFATWKLMWFSDIWGLMLGCLLRPFTGFLRR